MHLNSENENFVMMITLEYKTKTSAVYQTAEGGYIYGIYGNV